MSLLKFCLLTIFGISGFYLFLYLVGQLGKMIWGL
jgi:hypothetical protein